MLLARYVHHGTTAIGFVEADHVVQAIDDTGRSPDMLPFASDAWLSLRRGEAHSLAEVRLQAPVAKPGKIVAIGVNYVDHAREGDVMMPREPLVFAKFPSSIIGPGDVITWQHGVTDAVDFEAELAVVIGTTAREVNERQALEHVFGYTCLNDVTARDLQFADGQWVRGKSLDTFCPIGPWVTTADEIADPQALGIACHLSGVTMQNASTADMFFSVAELIARLSRSFTLEPGDVIATGTPQGVGYFREPRRLLSDGDDVTVHIDRIGDLTNRVEIGFGDAS